MSERLDLADPDELAAEYALGVLEGDDLRRARSLARADEHFRAEVSRWLGRLAPMLSEIQDVEPPEAVWASIERRCANSAADERARPHANDNIVKLQRSLRRWRGFGSAMTAVAACLAIIVAGRLITPDRVPVAVPVERPAATPLVAMLDDPQEKMKVVASWAPGTRQLILVVPQGMPAPAGKAHQLWVIPSGGKPNSLGMMPAGQRSNVRIADELALLLKQGATIAISVEPSGGSPTGSPTGPVVASGSLSKA